MTGKNRADENKDDFKIVPSKQDVNTRWNMHGFNVEYVFNQLMQGNVAAEGEIIDRLNKREFSNDFRFLVDKFNALKEIPEEKLTGPEAFFLGKFFEKKSNIKEAMRFLQIAIDREHVGAMCHMANIHYQRGSQYVEVEKLLYAAADAGHPLALFMLGEHADEESEQFEFFRQAAAQGYPPANAVCGLKASEAGKDQESLRFYHAAAAGGDLVGITKLGVQYHHVHMDMKQAGELFQQAISYHQPRRLADLNKATTVQEDSIHEAASYLGEMYFSGDGVQQSIEESAFCFRIALENLVGHDRGEECTRILMRIGAGADLSEITRLAPIIIYDLGVTTALPQQLNETFIGLACNAPELKLADPAIFKKLLIIDIQADPEFVKKLEPLFTDRPEVYQDKVVAVYAEYLQAKIEEIKAQLKRIGFYQTGLVALMLEHVDEFAELKKLNAPKSQVSKDGT